MINNVLYVVLSAMFLAWFTIIGLYAIALVVIILRKRDGKDGKIQ